MAMTKYFTKTFKPDIVNGTIGNVIQSDTTDLAFANGDILFDWHAIDMPRGIFNLVNTTIYMVGEDGANQANLDLTLVFAKSIDGVAPLSLGSVNAAPSGSFTAPQHIIGATKLEASANGIGQVTLGHGTVYYGNVSGNNGTNGMCVLSPESESGSLTKSGFSGLNKLYVAAICESAGPDFSTGVLSNAGVSDDSTNDITVKTVDVRKAFQPGDIVYIHDVNTAIGTVSSVPDDTSLILTSNNVGAISTNDEFINATPITVTLNFEQ